MGWILRNCLKKTMRIIRPSFNGGFALAPEVGYSKIDFCETGNAKSRKVKAVMQNGRGEKGRTAEACPELY